MHLTFVSPVWRKTVPVTIEDGKEIFVSDLHRISQCQKLIPVEDSYFLLCNGRKVDAAAPLEDGQIYHIVPRLLGGKGGFGSMLRAIGAQIEKTTSREACRDLSGRRMRDINNEKKLKDWLAKEAEREKEKEEKKRERLARYLAPSQHKFDDEEYHEQRAKVNEDLEDALSKGLKRVHKQDKNGSSLSKKAKLANASSKAEWLGVDLDSDDLSSDSDNEADPGPPSELRVQSSAECGDTDGISSTKKEAAAIEVKANPQDKEDNNTSQGHGTQKVGASLQAQGSDTINHSNTQAESSTTTDPETSLDTDPIDLDAYASESQLQELGLERLKNALILRGLKCGGTLEERAQRLFSVKGLTTDEIDPSLFAKSKGKGKKSK